MRPEDAIGLMSDIRKRSDEQARQRLVEIALRCVQHPKCSNCEGVGECSMCHSTGTKPLTIPAEVRRRAGFRDISAGSWCAAGLTAAMEDAGLLVPAPGTPARRGAIALLDFVADHGIEVANFEEEHEPQPGDIIAWKQRLSPQEWLGAHAFATQASAHSLCGKVHRMQRQKFRDGERCSSCVWETRKGHVALIVAVDEESLTTVGWNEGPSPGRVMMRRLWRQEPGRCHNARWQGGGNYGCPVECWVCKGTGIVKPSSTVIARKQGMIYGIARPVAA